MTRSVFLSSREASLNSAACGARLPAPRQDKAKECRLHQKDEQPNCANRAHSALHLPQPLTPKRPPHSRKQRPMARRSRHHRASARGINTSRADACRQTAGEDAGDITGDFAPAVVFVVAWA